VTTSPSTATAAAALDHFQADADGRGATITLRGNVYTFSRASVSIERGIQLIRAQAEARKVVKARADGIAYTPKPVPYEGPNGDDTEIDMFLELVGDQRAPMHANGLGYDDLIHFGMILTAWFITGPDNAAALFDSFYGEGDGRPPADSSGSSTRQRTSRTSSTKRPSAKSKASKPRATRGRTTSTAGSSSKPTSTASTE
jgi:hypothetical protein